MKSMLFIGLLLVIFGGICSGIFAIPFKCTKKWNWENHWFIWSIIALIIAPWFVSSYDLKSIITLYSQNTESLIYISIFGLLWGFGAILFGKGIAYLGNSLGLSIMQGLINIIGTMAPIIYLDSSKLLSPLGMRLLIGICIMFIGILMFANAGKSRDGNTIADGKNKNFKRGLIICILAGILGPMINISFVYGQSLIQSAVDMGMPQYMASNTVWSIALTSGAIINIIECVRLFKKNKSWSLYKTNTRNGLLADSLSGIIWFSSILLYGIGVLKMGKYGTSVGWATMQGVCILAANTAGILTKEWKGSDKSTMNKLYLGIVFLLIGILVIAFN